METCNTCRHWFQDAALKQPPQYGACVLLTGLNSGDSDNPPVRTERKPTTIYTRHDFGCRQQEFRP